MKYPCIVYHRMTGVTDYADNAPYNFTWGYDVTIIDPDPDSGLADRMIRTFEKVRFNRHYTADNLNHDVFTLYY